MCLNVVLFRAWEFEAIVSSPPSLFSPLAVVALCLDQFFLSPALLCAASPAPFLVYGGESIGIAPGGAHRPLFFHISR